MTLHDESRPETNLDEALAAARRDPANPNDFYDTLLNSDLLVPVLRVGSPSGDWVQVGLQDRFQPLFARHGELKVVPVFDQIARLKRWAGERKLDFLDVRCYVLLQLVASDVALLLNPGTAWSHTLTPDVLDLLRQAMRPISKN